MRKLINSLKRSIFRSKADRKGSILIIVTWSLLLLVTFAASLGYIVRQKLVLAYRLDERSKLHFIAEAGVKKTIIELIKQNEQNDEKEDYYSFNALCSNNAAAFKRIPVGDGRFTVSYEHWDEKEGITITRYGIVDEEGKMNINKADQKVLRRFFQAAVNADIMQAQELAAAIVDWRDKDSMLSLPVGSAEDREYRNREYPYESKDAQFDVLDEILLVRGMDRDIFEKIKDDITVYGGGRVNVNTASRTILFALGLDMLLIDKILSYRSGEDGEFGTLDDDIFIKHSEIVPRLSRFTHLGDADVAKLTQVASRYLTTNSSYYRIRSTAKLNNRKQTAEIICVVDQNGEILYWQGP